MKDVFHTNSAGGVVFNSDNKVVVIHQREKSWALPKGHIEKDENSLETAKREIYEECGISDLNYISDLGTYIRYDLYDPSEIKHITMYLFKTNEKTLQPKEMNTTEAKWINKEKVAELLTHEKDKEFYLQILEQIK